ncbi:MULTISPECIES: DUF433 domain-containing protein [Haloarcula]|uniref:DUF433 domain-containing protein n=1 Tax=Haloarcula TaxID=2237 RepID=UPI0023EC4D4B|nr:DUF433 domain-containing protein [Halomicroarcula sp. XH51]
MPDFPEASYNIDDEVIDIISTRDTLGGSPRLDGHRIAVYHILDFYRAGFGIKDIAGKKIYPHLSEEQVRAALHFAVDFPEAVERSSKPRDTPLHIDVSFDSRRGGPRLSVFDRDADEPGAIATATIDIDDLPDGYSERDLHAAWAWMFEQGDRSDSDGSDDRATIEERQHLLDDEENLEDINNLLDDLDDPTDLDDARARVRRLLEPYQDRDDLSPEMEAKLQGYCNALAVLGGEV